MNYYERHLGDYAKDTGHLTMLEHGAYTLLLDFYYASEKPIPAERAYKVARASSKDERSAVDAVLAEFFTRIDGAWHQKRCDKHIAQFQAKPSQEEKREGARIRQERTRERRRVLFDELRSHGVVMPYDAKMQELEDAIERVKSQQQTQSRHAPVTCDVTATQSPDTSIKTLSSSGDNCEREGGETKTIAAADPVHLRAVELTALLRLRGAALQAHDPRVREWAATGVTDAQALTAMDTANQRRAESGSTQPISAGYLDTIIRGSKPQQQTKPSKKSPHTLPDPSEYDEDRRRFGKEIDPALLTPEAMEKVLDGML